MTATSSPATAPQRPVSPPHRRYAKGEKRSSDRSVYLSIGVALIGVAVTLGPIIYLVVGGLRTQQDLSTNPTGIPDPIMWSNYGNILTTDIFWRQAANSLLVATLTTAGVVLFGTMAAYPLARYRFRGREGIFLMFTTGLMFPLTVAVLPLYLLLRDLGLSGLPGLIIPQIAFGLPMTIIILRPFLRALPTELEEAAFMDGVSRIGFFWRMLLPLAKPGMVTVGVLAFIASWNAYLLPLLLLTGDPRGMTLPLGITTFQGQYASATTLIMAYTSLAMIPALIFFLVMERRIVDGLTGAVKG
ncbi:carbohydrate ABC transporter permease [Demequina globuliformis]|uniref:carbohydrate ABC transporter permease n=1 Tax=Demequina globuliformis TaxID=676202 RepID=UPI00078163CC|nr:carbohydrate ABC transporter permease [Demequina globuliformis]